MFLLKTENETKRFALTISIHHHTVGPSLGSRVRKLNKRPKDWKQ